MTKDAHSVLIGILTHGNLYSMVSGPNSRNLPFLSLLTPCKHTTLCNVKVDFQLKFEISQCCMCIARRTAASRVSTGTTSSFVE